MEFNTIRKRNQKQKTFGETLGSSFSSKNADSPKSKTPSWFLIGGLCLLSIPISYMIMNFVLGHFHVPQAYSNADTPIDVAFLNPSEDNYPKRDFAVMVNEVALLEGNSVPSLPQNIIMSLKGVQNAAAVNRDYESLSIFMFASKRYILRFFNGLRQIYYEDPGAKWFVSIDLRIFC